MRLRCCRSGGLRFPRQDQCQQIGLLTFPGLCNLEPQIVRSLIDTSKVVSLPVGTRIFGPGQAPEAYLLLIKGTVRVQQVSDSGREIVLYRVSAGESCALTTACLMGDQEYQAEGIAETDIDAVAISRATFDNLIARSPEFRRFVFTAFSTRITDLIPHYRGGCLRPSRCPSCPKIVGSSRCKRPYRSHAAATRGGARHGPGSYQPAAQRVSAAWMDLNFAWRDRYFRSQRPVPACPCTVSPALCDLVTDIGVRTTLFSPPVAQWRAVMSLNVGIWDRNLRIGIGVALLSLVVVGAADAMGPVGSSAASYGSRPLLSGP